MLLFLILIGVVVVLAQLLQWVGTSVAYEVINRAATRSRPGKAGKRMGAAPGGVGKPAAGLYNCL